MHLCDNSIPLKERNINDRITDITIDSNNIEFVILPYFQSLDEIPRKNNLYIELNKFIKKTKDNSVISILTSSIFATDFCAQLNSIAHLKLWISVKLEKPIKHSDYINENHAALLILTRNIGSLKHTKTRIGYSYCPTCNKTTKDYGGKKHLYHEFGTLMSDVWRDITVDFNSFPTEIINRLKDLFGLPEFEYVNVYDQRKYYIPSTELKTFKQYDINENYFTNNSLLIQGDCIEELKKIPNNSIDFCFADPPYNLNKKYESWDDGIDIKTYFDWCDNWLSELARILKPGRTLAILNIPQWCVRHFQHLIKILDYQDWIVWEGLSVPVRMIMPAHYSILCFSKGKPRQIPCISNKNMSINELKSLESLKSGFCIRQSCITNRRKRKIKDTEFVTNLWTDIHRLKHNSKRVDHPCQLPPMFMYRLISMFTNENEIVLDPFNGAGTTTLCAAQLNRKYIGIELSEYYHNITTTRHSGLSTGINPFRKNDDDSPKVKNSRVERLKKQKYEVSKKVLQLEVKQISEQLGKIPSKEDIIELSQYPIEYFESYFINWAEVTAAARTTGMKEDRADYKFPVHQLRLFNEPKPRY